MSIQTLSAWLALSIQLALGIAVFRANPKSRTNKSFLVVSAFITAWLISILFAFNASEAAWAELWIRNASASGILMVTGFNLLRLSIVYRETAWRKVGRKSTLLAMASAAMVVFCYTPLFLRYAEIRPGGVPAAVYGPMGSFYLVFLVGGFVTVVVLYIKDLKRSAGIPKIELGFVVAGFATLGALTVLGVLLQPVLPRALAVQMAPFRAVIFSAIIAYGIATRKIMDVGLFVRRILSYAVLTVYLLGIYALIWWLVSAGLRTLMPEYAVPLAHVAAAIVIAFAMAPARGLSQRLAERLFIGSHRLDFRGAMTEAATILKSVTTLEDLFERFAQTIARAVNTESVVVLVGEKGNYAQQYPPLEETDESRIDLPKDHPLVSSLKASRQLIVLDELYRIPATPGVRRVMTEMRQFNLAVVLGIFARDELEGVMLLGPRKSGRIYGVPEQEALLVLCGQLAVAIDNARLFTEAQDAKIYNDILLENMTTGVIAASTQGVITVFNREAERITGLKAEECLEKPVEVLPGSLAEMVRATLASKVRQESHELTFPKGEGEEESVARAASSTFQAQNGRLLGALVVLTDITAVKRLEMQVRRSDRLASLGVLSAGMAHEIKNPLVSIKTFTQLLPERYMDSDFRETFSTLIVGEIDRIDALVSQLLRFARPAKPTVRAVHMHDVLEKGVMLLGNRLYQKNIEIIRAWDAELDTIRADADQLEQVFLNFYLNAMDAMSGRGGNLVIETEVCSGKEWIGLLVSGESGEVGKVLRTTVRDTGEGILAKDLQHVFDPFFTTKETGTGLGLSVVHAIIKEHGGQINVESEPEKGTAFHVLLPLVRFEKKEEEKEVAAA